MLKSVKEYLIFAHFGKIWIKKINAEVKQDINSIESFAILAKLYDELSDSFSFTHEQIIDENFGLHIPEKRVLLLCLQECKTSFGSIEKWERSFMNVINPQIESLKQTTNSEAKESIEQITKNKGGSAVYFTFSAFLKNRPQEMSFFYQFGYFLQLVDDFFDAYFDAQDNIATLFSPINNLKKPFNYIEKQFTTLKKHSEYQEIKELKFIVYLLYVLSKTAQHYFCSLAPEQPSINFKKLSRKQGVVDLERWNLRLVFIKQFYKNRTKLID